MVVKGLLRLQVPESNCALRSKTRPKLRSSPFRIAPKVNMAAIATFKVPKVENEPMVSNQVQAPLYGQMANYREHRDHI